MLISFGQTNARFKQLADEHSLPCVRVKREVHVFLSPACASWDQYPNFETRGDHFIELVEKLK